MPFRPAHDSFSLAPALRAGRVARSEQDAKGVGCWQRFTPFGVPSGRATQPHFLTFSCYRRLPLLSKERTCLWLVEAIADGCHGLPVFRLTVPHQDSHG